MAAAAKAFLELWLPAMAVLVAGLWRAWQTGQADPWDWSIAVAALMAAAGFLLAHRGIIVLLWAAIGASAPILIFCALAAGRLELWSALGVTVIALLLVLAAAWVRHAPIRRGRVAALGMIAVAGLIFSFGSAQPLTPVDARPRLAVLTGLPLFWEERGAVGKGPRDAPIITVLRTRFTILPLDDPRDLPGTGARQILIAQPRALSPEQLVALDGWVRDGGRALVLADPLLRWSSALPLGDRRRAPTTTLLAPLLTRWGFVPGRLHPLEVRNFLADSRLMTVSSAWLPHGQAVPPQPVGRGWVRIMGDADMIDDRLWLADPAQPLNPRFWSADTPAVMLHWLGASAPEARPWMRGPADVMVALRWAILVGTGWAMLGGALLRQHFRRRGQEQKVKIWSGKRAKSV